MSEPQYHVANLSGPTAVAKADLDRVFGAAWSNVARMRLEPGESIERPLEESEVMIFILGGGGTVHVGELDQQLREGISLTFFQGETLNIDASPSDGLEFFLTEIRIEPR